MKKARLLMFIVFSLCIMVAGAMASEKVHWGYSGEGSPENWGKLDPAFSLCASGKNQSPIDLTGMIESELAPIAFNYKAGGNEVLNNGHAIQVNYAPGSTISLNGHEFELKQFHFHAPSENTIEGESFPMEAHFVHADNNGNLAVVALMFKAGEKNEEIEKAWAKMPMNAEEKSAPESVLDAAVLLSGGHDYYRFNGSLTTPPCSEGVCGS